MQTRSCRHPAHCRDMTRWWREWVRTLGPPSESIPSDDGKGPRKSGSQQTRRWREVDSNPRSRRGLPTCYAVSPIIRPPDCTSCCPGIGRYAKSPPLPLDNLPSRPWPDAYQWYRALSRSGGSRPVHCVGCSNHIQSANGSNFPWMKGGGRSPDVHQAKVSAQCPSARRAAISGGGPNGRVSGVTRTPVVNVNGKLPPLGKVSSTK